MSRCCPGSLHVLHCLPFSEQVFTSLVLISVAWTLGFWDKVKEFKVTHYCVSEKLMYRVTTESVFTFWGSISLLSVMVSIAMFLL